MIFDIHKYYDLESAQRKQRIDSFDTQVPQSQSGGRKERKEWRVDRLGVDRIIIE